MGKFVLIDFKKREEHAELQKLVPTIGMKMDQWIKNHDAGETPPNEDEAKGLEDAQIQQLLVEFDTKAAQLWRVKDEHGRKRQIVEVDLKKRKGRLFRKYADQVNALKDQAADTMQYCVYNLESFESNLLEGDVLPTTEEDLEKMFIDFLSRMDEYVESTFPDGVAGMDSFDDVLPDGLPSYSKFKELVTTKQDEYKSKNTEMIPDAVEKVKSKSKDMFKDVINRAINEATEEIVKDLSDDTLPYLDDDAMQSLREEVIAAAKEYGASRIEE